MRAEADAVHEVEVFGPVATIVPYRDEQDACAMVARGGGSLVASIYGDDTASARMVGRPRRQPRAPAGDRSRHRQRATGHGIVMPQCNHGGPGRAGAGEELGGLYGMRFYHQRLAVQGSTELLASLQAQAGSAALTGGPMAKYVALLRAINVGGTGKLPMTDLKTMCETPVSRTCKPTSPAATLSLKAKRLRRR